jgi:hypothetical protein
VRLPFAFYFNIAVGRNWNFSRLNFTMEARVAQWIECLPTKQKVLSSILSVRLLSWICESFQYCYCDCDCNRLIIRNLIAIQFYFSIKLVASFLFILQIECWFNSKLILIWDRSISRCASCSNLNLLLRMHDCWNPLFSIIISLDRKIIDNIKFALLESSKRR